MAYLDETHGIETRKFAAERPLTTERPLGELVSELTRETATLVRQEVALAKAEVGQKAKVAASKGAVVGAGAILSLAAVFAFTATLILLFAIWLEAWAAALLVTVLLAVAGAGLVTAGARALKRVDLVPRVTARTMDENKQWLKEQVKQ